MDATWDTFFATLAQVSVTLLGIMFAVLQVRYRDWSRSPLRTMAAICSLVELFVPVVVSLIAGMPTAPWRVAAGIGGAIGLVSLLAHWWIYRQAPEGVADDFDRQQIRWNITSLCVYLTLISTVVADSSQGPYVVAGVSIWLLFSGTAESWYLMAPNGLRFEKR